MKAALVALLLAGCAGQQVDPYSLVPRSACALNEAFLSAKRGCGFLDLGREIEVTGEAWAVWNRHSDGDWSIKILPIAEHDHYRRPFGDEPEQPWIKAEFQPCEHMHVDIRAKLERARELCAPVDGTKGQCSRRVVVTVRGRWAWDGVDHRGPFRDQLRACLSGRKPDPAVGWPEIHPAWGLEIEGETFEAVEPRSLL